MLLGWPLTTKVEDPEQGTQDPNVREHDAEGNQGKGLCDDVVDEEVAAARQGGPHQLWDPSCTDRPTASHMMQNTHISESMFAAGPRL